MEVRDTGDQEKTKSAASARPVRRIGYFALTLIALLGSFGSIGYVLFPFDDTELIMRLPLLVMFFGWAYVAYLFSFGVCGREIPEASLRDALTKLSRRD